MLEYKIICDMFEPCGMSFRYAINPKKTLLEFTFKRSEREQFIEKVKYLQREDMYYDDIKMYFIDYNKLTIVKIEDIKQLEEAI